MQLTKQRHEQGRLPRASGAYNQVNLPALEEQLVVDNEYKVPFARPAWSARARGGVDGPSERRMANANNVRSVFGDRSRSDSVYRLLKPVAFRELVDELCLLHGQK